MEMKTIGFRLPPEVAKEMKKLAKKAKLPMATWLRAKMWELVEKEKAAQEE